MIKGHGDDIYEYGTLRCNFSSNISSLIDTSELCNYLSKHLDVINHYPEPSAQSLEERIADEYHISPKEVLVTSGATDAIYLIAQSLRHEQTFAVKRPTFSEYVDACRMFGYEEAPKGGAVRWLCNPNNPTGEVRSIDTMKVLSRRHHWLVIDQSYEDSTYCQMLAPKEAIEMRNVIQIHSMTKRFGIPGLRLGYITAPASVIERLRANHRPWAVNALAIEAGMDTLKRDYPDVAEKLAAHLDTPVDDTALEVFDSLKELDYVKPMSEEYAPVTHTYDEFNLNTVEDTFYEYTFYVGTKQETVDQLHIEFLRRDGKYYLVFIEPSAV